MLENDVYEIFATVRSSAQKNVNPKTSNDGSIFNTPLQKLLKVKNGAKVLEDIHVWHLRGLEVPT